MKYAAPTVLQYKNQGAEYPTRVAWGNKLAMRKDELRTPVPLSHNTYGALFNAKSACRWSTLIAVCELLKVNFDEFRPEPLDPASIKSYQLIECDTDEQAQKLCDRLENAGKQMHASIDRRAGIYHAFGDFAVRVDVLGQTPDGYQILPAHMFI